MKRNIPVDTNTFHYFNANPKNKITDDCMVRALCTALEQSWEITLKELTEMAIKTGEMVNSTKMLDRYLESKGWHKHKQPRKLDNTKYTGKEWCEELQDFVSPRRMVANIGGHHTVAIIDGKVWDTWNSTYKSIGNYWYKP